MATQTDPTKQQADAVERLSVTLATFSRWLESRSVQAEIAEASGLSLTPPMLGLLEHLDGAAGMRVSDIAECHRVGIPTMTTRLQALEADGLVVRAQDQADLRVSLITISDEGRRAVARMRAARRARLDEVLAELSTRQLDTMAGAFDDIAQRIADLIHAATP